MEERRKEILKPSRVHAVSRDELDKRSSDPRLESRALHDLDIMPVILSGIIPGQRERTRSNNEDILPLLPHQQVQMPSHKRQP